MRSIGSIHNILVSTGGVVIRSLSRMISRNTSKISKTRRIHSFSVQSDISTSSISGSFNMTNIILGHNIKSFAISSIGV